MKRTIAVLAAESQTVLEHSGAAVSFEFDTIREAKERAKYYLTEEYRVRSEASERLGYSQVVVDGECVADYFGKGGFTPDQAEEILLATGADSDNVETYVWGCDDPDSLFSKFGSKDELITDYRSIWEERKEN